MLEGTPSATRLLVRHLDSFSAQIVDPYITPAAAATSVESEPLEHEFNGILGLALPSNSVIAQSITPASRNGSDGASFASNLFDTTANKSAPSSRFFSLTLSRPGTNAIPSQLGIGRHPPQLVPDPSRVSYSAVVQDPGRRGTPFWELQVSAITLYFNGSRKSVKLDAPRSGNALPTAILDSGVPSILATSDIANGIYGALGIGPASDGQCKDDVPYPNYQFLTRPQTMYLVQHRST